MASITLDEATRIKDTVAADLLQKPGVTGVDVGLRSAGGGRADEPVIRVYVKSRTAVPADLKAMTTVQGVPVEIIERTYSLH